MSSTQNAILPVAEATLSTLPVEIVIQILSEVPIASFLNIPEWVKLLEVSKTAGWFVPTHQQLIDNENDYLRNYQYGPFWESFKHQYTGYKNYIKSCSLLGSVSFPSGQGLMWISSPSPQFLYFLEYPRLKRITVDKGEDWWPWRPFEIDPRAFGRFMNMSNDR